MLSSLDIQDQFLLGEKESTVTGSKTVSENLNQTHMLLQAVLGKINISVNDFINLECNDVLTLDTRVNQDILPFSTVEGNPAQLYGANAVGLKRANFKPDVRVAIKKALKIIVQPDLNTNQALEKILVEIEMSDEIQYLVDFTKNSSRGVTK